MDNNEGWPVEADEARKSVCKTFFAKVTSFHFITTPDERPTTPDERPITLDERPTTPDERPTTPDEPPARYERSTTPDKRPTTPDKRPITPDERPTTPDQRLPGLEWTGTIWDLIYCPDTFCEDVKLVTYENGWNWIHLETHNVRYGTAL
jgi:hypothetical protein